MAYLQLKLLNTVAAHPSKLEQKLVVRCRMGDCFVHRSRCYPSTAFHVPEASKCHYFPVLVSIQMIKTPTYLSVDYREEELLSRVFRTLCTLWHLEASCTSSFGSLPTMNLVKKKPGRLRSLKSSIWVSF